MATGLSSFQDGADFISFDASPLPSPHANGNAEAGPSRSAPKGTTGQKRKDRLEDDLDSSDERLSETKNGRRDGNGHGVEKANGKKKGKKAKGDTNGDTGPNNLKEERKAAERHAPWADLVDWERCQDPAEMFAFQIGRPVKANHCVLQVERRDRLVLPLRFAHSPRI